MTTCVLWSGGKDSFAALALARATRPTMEPVVLATFAPPGARFRCHPLPLLERQAEALGLAHLLFAVDGDDWRGDYARAFATLRDGHGVLRLVSGDIFVEPWLPEEAAAAGLELLTPLAELERPEEIFDVLDRRGATATVSGVRVDHYRPDFLGRPIGRALLAELGLDDDEAFHPCGELGEYHTVVTALSGRRLLDEDPRTLGHVLDGRMWALDFPPPIGA